MYFYEGPGSGGAGANRTLNAVGDSTGLTLELRKIDSNDGFDINGVTGVTILPKGGTGSGSGSINFGGGDIYMRLISYGGNSWIVTEQY